MRSPLAPRMTTVSDSMPSYWFVWYIHTPHSSDRESWLEPMVLACPVLPALHAAYRGTRRAYIATNLHKNQSQICILPVVGTSVHYNAISAARHLRRRARSRNA